MSILDYGDLTINNTVIKYDGRIKVERGTKTRTPLPQVNGEIVYQTDISTERSKITVPIRVSPESNKQFDRFFDNGDNNIISFRDENFSKATMEVVPEREDQEIVEYVFFANPAV
jgi:hypothetical protein